MREDLREPHDPGSRPWRLGLLSLLALVVVAGGVLLFGGDDDQPSTADGDPSITIPPLPGAGPADDTAPDFSVGLFDGTRFRLSDHLEEDGRPVILNLWASWCPPCRDEMPDLEEAAVANPGVVILGVAVDDDPIAAENFAGEIEITYPAGYDESGIVSVSYPTAGLPATFVISSDGKLVTTVFGRLTAADIDELVEIALGA